MGRVEGNHIPRTPVRRGRTNNQGSPTVAAVRGFCTGARDGVVDYYKRKYEGTDGAIDAAVRTATLVDDGWDHVKRPIKKKAREIDRKVDESGAQRVAWEGAKMVGSAADRMTTGTGVVTGVAAGTASTVVGAVTSPTVGAVAGAAISGAGKISDAVSEGVQQVMDWFS